MAIVYFVPRPCILLLLLLLWAVAGAPPARKKVAVEGVVYCKFCERDPTNSSHYWMHQLSPLVGAAVRLQCNNTARSWEVEVKTGGGGKFLIQPERVSSWGAHKCKLFLVSSQQPGCFAPTDHYPGFDNAPWKYGFPLTKTNSTLTLQYYASAFPLLYFYYWPVCM